MNILNKKYFKKILFRYGIPFFMLGIVVEILVIAPQKIEKKKDLALGADIPKVSDSTEQQMRGVRLFETNANGKDWELWADKAYNFREDGSWAIEKVKIRIYGKKNIFYDVTGDHGHIDPKRKNILIDGNVETITSNGYLMKMAKALYKADEKTLNADSEIHMYGPEVKGESRLELTGYGMITDLNTNDLKILKDIKARKVLQRGQLVTITSDSAIFNSSHYTARFIDHVISDYGAYRVTGNEAILEVDPKYHKVNMITVKGQVKLSDIQRWAVAEQMKIFVPEKKIVLSGSPRLIQNNSELAGDEITFFQETSQVQVKKAKAKLQRGDGVIK